MPILKSGVIDEMAYTLFTDGSIEANMPDGTMRFASIEELRQHIEKQFEISEAQLKQIEEEGLENEWPPLNEAAQPMIR